MCDCLHIDGCIPQVVGGGMALAATAGRVAASQTPVAAYAAAAAAAAAAQG